VNSVSKCANIEPKLNSYTPRPASPKPTIYVIIAVSGVVGAAKVDMVLN